MLHLARLSTRRPFAAFFLWFAVAAALAAIGLGVSHSLSPTIVVVPGSETARAERLAESNAEVTMLSVEQAALDLEQDVIRAVLEFNVQSERIRIAAKADEVAGRRYAAAERRWKLGSFSDALTFYGERRRQSRNSTSRVEFSSVLHETRKGARWMPLIR